MTELEKIQSIPEDLLVDNPTIFLKKLADFASAGPTGIHAVFDFDRTLTVKKPGSHDEVTTWHILQEHLPTQGRVRYQELFAKYRILELDGRMTPHDASTWWSDVLNLFVEHEVTMAQVETSFLELANIRPGTLELFQYLSERGIPTILLSAGVRDVIDIWCRKHQIKPSLIVSTSLTLDVNTRIVGWNKDTLVHTLNKSETTHPELASIRNNRPKALLVGDGLDDADMALGNDIIRTRILDPRGDESNHASEKKKTFSRFDAIIETGSLMPLRNLAERIIQ